MYLVTLDAIIIISIINERIYRRWHFRHHLRFVTELRYILHFPLCHLEPATLDAGLCYST